MATAISKTCLTQFYTSELKYGRVEFELDEEAKGISPSLEMFYEARLHTVAHTQVDALPDECPEKHGKLKVDLIFRNTDELPGFGEQANLQLFYL